MASSMPSRATTTSMPEAFWFVCFCASTAMRSSASSLRSGSWWYSTSRFTFAFTATSMALVIVEWPHVGLKSLSRNCASWISVSAPVASATTGLGFPENGSSVSVA